MLTAENNMLKGGWLTSEWPAGQTVEMEIPPESVLWYQYVRKVFCNHYSEISLINTICKQNTGFGVD